MVGIRFLIYAIFVCIPIVTSEDCELANNCRLVDINGDDDWINIPGHYRSIQECVNEVNTGDTCLVRSGTYHEEAIITDKKDLAIRGDLDFPRPIIDGTVTLTPIGGQWKEDLIDGKTVCIGEIEIKNDQHPFQLFLKENAEDELEMMTNARWPNALWTERHPKTGAPLVFYNDYWGKSDKTSERGKMIDSKVDGVSPLADSGIDMKGAMAVLNVGSYNTFVKPVKDHNAGDDFFTYEDDFGNIKWQPGDNQYYLDSHEALLDNPGEWFYNMNTNTLKFMPWSGSCPDPDTDAVRGRVIDYAMQITNTDGIYIGDLDFFASNVQAESTTNKIVVNEVYLDSLNFKFPSSSRRMLQDYNVPKITEVAAATNGDTLGTLSIKNCVFFGSEGSALHYYGREAKVINNLFKWNDWSGQQGLTANGGFGTVYASGRSQDEEFKENTLWYNGASAGFRPGRNAKILNNLVVGQCDGIIMHDGSGIQVQADQQPNVVIEGNWAFDSPKLGFRFDGSNPNQGGANGTMSRNVVWNTAGMRMKGDYHNVTGNLNLLNHEDTHDASLEVIHVLRDDPAVHNANTHTTNNAAHRADGGVDRIDDIGGEWPLAGIKLNNYYGNNSWNGTDGWDGSWVLNGTTLFPDDELPDLLMDIEDHDFRPKPDTVLTSTGVQIGPYDVAYSKTSKYNIPGRKEQKTIHPIPSHGNTVLRKDALIFQLAYGCWITPASTHMVYIVPKDNDFPPKDEPTAELIHDDNILYLSDIDVTIESGEKYKWRVDCVEGSDEMKRRTGDVWTFTMNE